MSNSNQPTTKNDIFDDLRNGLEHTGTKELLTLLENKDFDDSIIDNIVELIISRINKPSDSNKQSNQQIIGILNKIVKLNQRLELYKEKISSLNDKESDEYLLMLKENYIFEEDKLTIIEK